VVGVIVGALVGLVGKAVDGFLVVGSFVGLVECGFRVGLVGFILGMVVAGLPVVG